MKVLHVLPSLDQRYGGPIRAILDLSAGTRSFGIESEILGVGPVRLPDNPLPMDAIHSVTPGFPAGYRYSPELIPWLRNNLRAYAGLILHGMWTYPNVAVYRECRRQSVPYAYFPHGMLERWPVFGQGYLVAARKAGYWALIEKNIFRRASAALYTTEREAASARQTFSLPPIPSLIVPYGASVDERKVLSPSNPALAIKGGLKVALFLGRLHPKKNVDFLIRCWKAADVPDDWRLVIAGSGEHSYEELLKRLVHELNLEGHVVFTGAVAGDDKSYLFQRSSWFLLPSSQENFGNAVLEAIRHGCAVVISDQVYFSEFLNAGAEVLGVNTNEWVEFFGSRMCDEERRQRRLKADRESVESRFDPAGIAPGWAAMLRTLFDRAGVTQAESVPNACVG